MGLDTSHDCWSGPYSSFNHWRRALCVVAGYGSLDDRHGFGGDTPWPDDDPLVILLYHSDCDGDIEWKDCQNIADKLKELLPALERTGNNNAEDARQFIDGLETAYKLKENVDFH